MAIFLPGAAEDQALALDQLTPREIVAELDKYVIGQHAAKRAVAIALRNRMRRQKLPPDLADDIMPKNIIMIGPTGVGKTEIARRLAKLTNSPFLKVEASKFTEVGYVGRDVESIVRDLVEISIDLVRDEKLEEIEDKAELSAEDRLLDLLLPPPPGGHASSSQAAANASAATEVPGTNVIQLPASMDVDREEHPETMHVPEGSRPLGEEGGGSYARSREKLRQQFREGRLDEQFVELDVRDRNQPQFEFIAAPGFHGPGFNGPGFNGPGFHGPGGPGNGPDFNGPGGPDAGDMSLKDMLPGLFSQRTRKRRMKVAEAFDYLVQEEEQRLIDMDQVTRLAVERVEDSGIVFLDEIDKIAGREGGHGPDVSREGVQRDILPIVEGTTVSTKYGMVSTDHILFIAAGAFHVSKPSDLIPELQGRFPIRVELQSLTVGDFVRILTEPRNSLVKQSVALLDTEGLHLEFTPEALHEMAEFAFRVNETTENIGARRLHTILERVLDEISFQAPDLVKGTGAEPTREGVVGQVQASAMPGREAGAQPSPAPLPVIERKRDDGATERVVVVDPEYVRQQVQGIVKNQDLSRYIL